GISVEQWRDLGGSLLDILDSEAVLINEFFRLLILSVFTKNRDINHFHVLARRYQSSDPCARREIILSARANSAIDWLREHKETFTNMDPWQRLAFIYSSKLIPKDEKKFFLNHLHPTQPFEVVLTKWAKA
ncbi:MAG: hypothetical protein WCK65_15870, partial [Rhodospirillaceae bacterium]